MQTLQQKEGELLKKINKFLKKEYNLNEAK